jgi:hypothetical protein
MYRISEPIIWYSITTTVWHSAIDHHSRMRSYLYCQLDLTTGMLDGMLVTGGLLSFGVRVAAASSVKQMIVLSYPCLPGFQSQFYVAVHTVSRRLPTAAVRVPAQVKSCGICGGQSGTGVGFLRVLQFPLPILISSTAPHSSSSSSIIRGWYNKLISGRRTKWTQSHLTPRN